MHKASNRKAKAQLTKKQKPIWGLAKGLYTVPDNIDALNAEIESLFNTAGR